MLLTIFIVRDYQEEERMHMDIQTLPHSITEQADGNPTSAADIAADISSSQSRAEMELIEHAENSCTIATQRNDSAEISRESKTSGTEEADTARKIARLLEKLSVWQTYPNTSLENELARLKELYTDILKHIIQLTGSEEQKRLLCLLETYLFENLGKLTQKHFNTLDSFFQRFGERQHRICLYNSLFQYATGRTLPPDKVSRFLLKEHSSFAGQFSGKETASKNVREGIVYFKSPSEKEIPYSKAFSRKQLLESDYWQRVYQEPLHHAEGPVSRDLFSENKPTLNMLYRAQDLKTAEKFLTELLGKGNLLMRPELSACNSQIKGFLAAATWLKTDAFLQASGIQKGLSASISQAVDKLLLVYINSVAGSGRSAALADLPGDIVPQKESCGTVVSDIYCRLRIICLKEQNAGSALTAALKYAYAQYVKQNESGGFFFKHPDMEKDEFKKGYLLLRKDWKQFIDRLPVPLRTRRELEESFNSPWGTYVSPLNPLYNPKAAHPAILGGIITVGIIIALCLFT